MRTHRAELAPFRTAPLHPAYVRRCHADAERRAAPGPKSHAFETTCPYCGKRGHLFGTIRVGAKKQVSDVPMTASGFEVPIETEEDRELDCVLIECTACDAKIDPLAYFSPAVFYADREDIDLF